MRVILTSALLLLSCATARADLSDLIQLARNQAEVQADYQKETSSYIAVKSAYDRGALTKATPKAKISAQFGPPVVKLPDKETGMEKWIYKKAPESFFGGEQIYLYFDGKGLLAKAAYRPRETKKEGDDGTKK